MMTGRLPPWRPANCGNGKRIWFLCRYSGLDDDSVPFRDRYHYDKNAGQLIRYASHESALRAADRLNAAEQRARSARTEANAAFVRTLLAQREPGYAAALEDAAAGIVT